MKTKKSKLLSIVLSIVLIFTMIMPVVNADDQTGSLTIIKYGVENGEYSLLAGVTFALYKVDDYYEGTTIPEGANLIGSKITDSNGEIVFENLAIGRYLVVETDAPDNVTAKCANFLVDIPTTEEDGKTQDYDVTVYPKNNTVYGGITLTKYDTDGKTPLGGVEFKLQKYNDNSWEDYGASLVTATEATTSDSGVEISIGQILVEGLPAGTYRFIETSALTDYILDNYSAYEFTVSESDVGGTIKTVVSPDAIEVTNDKPEVQIVVDDEKEPHSYNTGDTISFDITADVPSSIVNLGKYEVTITLPDGLDYSEDSLKVYDEDGKEITEGFEASDKNGIVTITFTPAELENHADSQIDIKFDTTLNENATVGSDGNKIEVSLEYSTITTTDADGKENETASAVATATDEVEVYTGGFYIKKVANSENGDPLEGAQFKIALDKDGENTVKDADGEDVVLKSDSNGFADFAGLEYGTYYLIETHTKEGYHLLTSSVEFTIDGNTYSEDNAIVVINHTEVNLPVTGGIGIAIIVVIGIALISGGVVIYRKGSQKK